MATRESGRNEWNRDRDRQRDQRWQGQRDEGGRDEGRYQQEGYGQQGYGQYEGDYYGGGGGGRGYQGSGGTGDYRGDYTGAREYSPYGRSTESDDWIRRGSGGFSRGDSYRGGQSRYDEFESGRNYGGGYGGQGYGGQSYGRDEQRYRSADGGGGQRYSGGFYTGESGAGAYDQYGDRGAEFGGQRTQYGQYGHQGQQGQGQQHSGRGPKGYQRSDERIREDVCECLTHDPRVDASNLEVSVKNCEVTLSGTVNSREDKRRAADLAEYISGVKDVHNNLRVAEQSSGGTSQQNTTGQTQSPRH